MDPYLERHWLDVHGRLVTYTADQLNERLPRSLIATTEERIAIDSESSDDLLEAAPDVRVVEPGGSEPSTHGIAYHAPLKLVVDIDPRTEHFVKIIRPDDEQLVAAIEIISPSNKIGEGMKQFRTKRKELIASGVHVIEIDLVRQGNWRALMRPHICPRNHVTEYRVTVRLGGDQQQAYGYPALLRQPLPAILVPLRKDDPQVQLELQSLVDLVYQKGRYHERLDYRRTLEPPLPLWQMKSGRKVWFAGRAEVVRMHAACVSGRCRL